MSIQITRFKSISGRVIEFEARIDVDAMRDFHAGRGPIVHVPKFGHTRLQFYRVDGDVCSFGVEFKP